MEYAPVKGSMYTSPTPTAVQSYTDQTNTMEIGKPMHFY